MPRYTVTIEQETVQIGNAAEKLYDGNKGKVKTRTALAMGNPVTLRHPILTPLHLETIFFMAGLHRLHA